MRRIAILLSVVIVFVPSLWRGVEACGDKLLMVGRGVKFGRAYASVHPGNILIYARPSTNANAAIRDARFHKTLRQAGHAVSVIENQALLEQALRTVAIDVVLSDVTDKPVIEPIASTGPSHPALRYVFFPPPNKQEAKRLQQLYACPLNASDAVARYLDVIEETMKERAVGLRVDKK